MGRTAFMITFSLSPSEHSPYSPNIPFLISHFPVLCFLYHYCFHYPVLFLAPFVLPCLFPPHTCMLISFLFTTTVCVVPIHSYTLFDSLPVPIHLANKSLQFYSPFLTTTTFTMWHSPFPFMYTQFATLLHILLFPLPF